jgi:hypothetical protein
LHGLARQVFGPAFVKSTVDTGDRDQLGLHRQRKNSGLCIARGTGQCAASQRCIDVDAAVGALQSVGWKVEP